MHAGCPGVTWTSLPISRCLTFALRERSFPPRRAFVLPVAPVLYERMFGDKECSYYRVLWTAVDAEGT